MNQLRGVIVDLNRQKNFALVQVKVDPEFLFQVFVIYVEENSNFIQKKRPVILLFKEVEVVLAKTFSSNISILNQFSAFIQKKEGGHLLTQVHLDFFSHSLTAIVPTSFIEKMQVNKGEKVFWMIKANEIILIDDENNIPSV